MGQTTPGHAGMSVVFVAFFVFNQMLVNNRMTLMLFTVILCQPQNFVMIIFLPTLFVYREIMCNYTKKNFDPFTVIPQSEVKNWLVDFIKER